LTRQLLDADDHELRRAERREADEMFDDALLTSSWVVVSRSHFTRLARVAICRERALHEEGVHERAHVRRICAHNASSFGSKTTHVCRVQTLLDVERQALDGMYLYSDVIWSAPRSVRAPQETTPNTGNTRRQLTPSGFRIPFSPSVSA